MAETPTYATPAQVRTALGPIGVASPDIIVEAGIDLDEQLKAAHAEVLDKLFDVYGPTLPTIAPDTDARVVVVWAEAKLCAANILDILRASLDTDSEIPERLRRSAWDTLARGLPGLRPGDDPATPPAVVTWAGQPGHTSSTPVSNFPNPYGDDEPVDLTVGWYL